MRTPPARANAVPPNSITLAPKGGPLGPRAMLRPRRGVRRGFALAIVIWSVALTLIILSSLQLSAWRQANEGREALARVRALWAARASVESVVARLQQEFGQASPTGPQTLLAQLADVSRGELAQARFEAVHRADTGEEFGPVDAHAKLNVNALSFDDLMLLPNMDEFVADAILDWIDPDDDIREAGAEREAYSAAPIAYVPRNGPVRSLAELLLVQGVRPEFLFGPEAADIVAAGGMPALGPATVSTGVNADSGWSAYLTASSISGGLGASGQPRLDLTSASAEDVASVLGVDSTQADAILAHAQSGGKIEDFLRTDLRTLAQQAQGGSGAGGGGAQRQPQVANLSRDELTLLLDECTVGDPLTVSPGKLNINTCDESLLEYVAAVSPTLRDALVLYRDQRGGDITTLTDLLDVPQISNSVLADLYPYLDVRSNVYQIHARGRDLPTGLSVEIFAEVDRSTNPVTIRNLIVR
jgi:DNA uptake protein ComE-like DNA-binding protein